MTFFKKQVPFVSSIKKKILIGSILGFILGFIIIFLEPFDTNNYQPINKNLILSVFGVLLFFTYFIHSSIENIFYYRLSEKWVVFHEIISALVFFTISGSVLYLYNHRFINGYSYTISSYFSYLVNIVLVFVPIFLPIFIYLRNKLGEKIIPLPKYSFIIKGENKNEILRINKKDLLYVKSVENYIDICFFDVNKSLKIKTFRQTLLNANKQLPFLEKCHRSYLLNVENVSEIKGNSKNARVKFNYNDKSIPLSKTYYEKIKSRINT